MCTEPRAEGGVHSGGDEHKQDGREVVQQPRVGEAGQPQRARRRLGREPGQLQRDGGVDY